MDRGAWQATVHGVSKSWTQLSIHIQWLGMLSTFSCTCLSSVCLFQKNIVSVPVSILNRIVWVFCYWRVWCCVFLISFTLFFFNVYFYLFIWLCQVLVVACKILDLLCDMWDFFFSSSSSSFFFFSYDMWTQLQAVRSSSLTRDGTGGALNGSTESQPLNHPASPHWISSDSLFMWLD